MNRTFKVVFSKVRGTMVVASEAAATPHKKAAKTVIAAAAALAMGTAMAQGWDEPDGIAPTSNHYTAIEDLTQGQYNYVQNGGKTGFVSISTEGDHVIEGKEIWVTATGSRDTQSYALHANGTGVKLTNTGKIYIQADGDAKSWSQKGMMAGGGATVVNEGDIVAKNAYGMTVETDKASNIENGVHGTITVLEQGAGIELGGASGSTAVNNGTITASSDGNWAHGVLIKAPVSGNSYKFTNNGEITANGPGASAIEVQAGDEGEVTSAEINLIEGSKIEGIVRIGANTDVTLNAKGTDDSFDLQADASANFNLNVTDDANLTLKDGNSASIDNVTIENGGQLNASIWQTDNKFTKVRVNEGGIFNITKLNSGGSQSQDPSAEGYVPHDTLLLAYGADYTLDGGKLYVDGSEYHDNLKIGTKNEATQNKGLGHLTIENGNYSFDRVELGPNVDNTLTIKGGTLTADTFNATYGTTTVSGGGVLVSDNIEYTAGGNGTVKLSDGGTLRTSGKNIFVQSDEGEGDSWGLSGFAEANFTGNSVAEGILEITDSFERSLEDLRKAQAMLGGTTLYFSNVTLTDEEVTFHENNGLTTANMEVLSDVASVEGTTTLHVGNTKNVGVGAIRVDASTTSISIVDNSGLDAGGLLISGMPNGGNVITGVNSVEMLTTTGVIQLGLNAGSQGIVNANMVNADNLVVLGNFRMNDLKVTDALDVDQGAFLTLNKLTGGAGAYASIEGGLSANVIDVETNVEDGGVLLIGERQQVAADDGEHVSLLINARSGGDETPPQYVDQIQDAVTGKIGSIVTTSANGAAALASAGFDASTQAGLYVDHTIGISETGGLVVGAAEEATVHGGNALLGSDAFTVINVGALSGGSAFVAKSLTSENAIHLTNITSLGQFTLVEGGTAEGVTVDTTSGLFTASVAKPEGGSSAVVDISYNDGFAGSIDNVVKDLVTNGTNQKNMNVLNAIADKNGGFVGEDGKLTNTGVRATKEYMVAPVTAGTYNMAYDSMELISNALIQRNLDAKKGLGVWADVFYGSNESDSLYGDSGYSSDIYGGMLGVDFGFGEGARVGAALSIGSGDGDSEGSVSKYSTDSDFWGLSVYAGKDFGGLTFTGDMSYLWLDNDIGGSVAGASASESLDSTVFSLGVRADWKAYEGKVLQVVPHAGVRWASIDVDDYRGLSMDKMNVIEMPIGVTVKGVFETASGWQVAPEIDFTAAPQIGDTEVETIIGDVDVIDNVYNASVGVNAGTDAVRFGLSYKYGFGNDGRSNNTFNLKASYLF